MESYGLEVCVESHGTTGVSSSVEHRGGAPPLGGAGAVAPVYAVAMG